MKKRGGGVIALLGFAVDGGMVCIFPGGGGKLPGVCTQLRFEERDACLTCKRYCRLFLKGREKGVRREYKVGG